MTTGEGTQPAAPAMLLDSAGMMWKALGIYALAFVAVAIVARAAIVGIGLPSWVFPGALIVMALGLPVILWTGYVHRVTRKAFATTPTLTPGGTPQLGAGHDGDDGAQGVAARELASHGARRDDRDGRLRAARWRFHGDARARDRTRGLALCRRIAERE